MIYYVYLETVIYIVQTLPLTNEEKMFYKAEHLVQECRKSQVISK